MNLKICGVCFNVFVLCSDSAVFWQLLSEPDSVTRKDLNNGFWCLPGLLFTLLQHILWSVGGRQRLCGVICSAKNEKHSLTNRGLTRTHGAARNSNCAWLLVHGSTQRAVPKFKNIKICLSCSKVWSLSVMCNGGGEGESGSAGWKDGNWPVLLCSWRQTESASCQCEQSFKHVQMLAAGACRCGIQRSCASHWSLWSRATNFHLWKNVLS